MDNIEKIKKLLYFEYDYYHRFNIVCRKHKNAHLNKTIRCIHIGSVEALDEHWEEMKKEADYYGARIYVDLIPKRLHKDYLRLIYPQEDRVYGAKQPLDEFNKPPKIYMLYDADKGHEEETDKFLEWLNSNNITYDIINSSEFGRHIIFDRKQIKNIDEIHLGKLHFECVNAMAYNPHC